MDKGEVFYLIFIGLVVVLAAYLAIQQFIYERLCLDNGYTEAKRFVTKGYCCVGVRDGRSVVVPVGEVGE